MPRTRMPPELVSLVHHIELNKEGWWEKAVQGLMTTTIWLAGKPLTLSDISKAVDEQFHVTLPQADANAAAERLCDENILLQLPDQRLKICERALAAFEQDLREAEHIEKEARASFIDIVRRCCPSLDADNTWRSFNEDFLLPLVADVGANTYSLLTGNQLTSESPLFPAFLDKFPSHARAGLRLAVETFLDPKDSNVRSYVLRALNAYFVVAASNLSQQSLKALASRLDHCPQFTVFVDTNVLFSLLGIHDNPCNEAALLLRHLVDQIAGFAHVSLYALPVTLAEAKRVFIAARADLNYVRLPRRLTEVALEFKLGGIATKFLQESRKTEGGLTAESYFAPYIRDLITVARSRGVELFNEDLTAYKTDPEVIEDIAGQLHYEKTHARKAKRYEQWEHDVILWQFARRKRPPYVESPAQARYWVLTIDYRFLAFDAFKTAACGGPVRVCLHPSTFINMLRLWVPRSDEFEAAMLSSLRLPFLFHEFDAEAERATLRILAALSRFENVDDLSTEVATRTLVNDALRQKMAQEPEAENQMELVRATLDEEAQSIAREASKEAVLLRKELTEKSRQLDRVGQDLRTATEKLEGSLQALHELEEQRRALGDRLERLEAGVAAARKEGADRKEILGFVLRWVVVPLCLVVSAPWLATALAPQVYGSRLFHVAPAMWVPGFLVWMWLVDRKGTHRTALMSWKLFAAYHRFWRWAFGVVGLVMVGILANAIWEYLKLLLRG